MNSNYEIFENYLSGELKDTELKKFQKELEDNQELAKELELFRQIRLGVSQKFWNAEEENALKGSLDQLSQDYFAKAEKEPAKVISMTRRVWLTTAAIAASILLLIFLWQPWQASLYDQFSGHPLAELSQRSSSPDQLKEMENAFKSGNYTLAINLFDNYLESNPNDSEILLLKGISHLELDQLEASRKVFQTLHEGASVYKYDGTWYMALSYLKENAWEQTKSWLNLIPSESERYTKAKELLAKLK